MSGGGHNPIGQPHDFQTLYVQGGACLLSPRSGPAMPTILQRCALEDLDCQDDDVNNLVARFRSSRQLLQDGPEAVGYECLQAVPDIGIGRCLSGPINDDAFACTSSRQACLTDNRDFVPTYQVPAGECTVAADRHPDRVRARAVYGECARVGTSTASAPNHLLIGCFWSVHDCNEAEFAYFLNGPDKVEWQRERTYSPDQGSTDTPSWNEECTCENVSTGACQDNAGTYHCAVSQNGCDDEEGYFISAYHLPDSVRCRLCQPDSVPDEPAPILAYLTGYPTASPTVVPDPPIAPSGSTGGATVTTVAPTVFQGNVQPVATNSPSLDGMRTNPEASDDNNAMAALSIVAVIVVLISIAAFWLHRRSRRSPNQEDAMTVEEESQSPQQPEEDAGISGVDDDGENHMVEAGVFG